MAEVTTADEKLLSVEEAARLAGVSAGTVRNWIKAGLLPAETTGDGIRIDYRVFVECKLLREADILALPTVKEAGVTDVDVTRAIVENVISPTAATERRFSISDALALARWKQGGAAAAVENVEPRASKAIAVLRAAVPTEWSTDYGGRWEMLIDYMTRHKDPAKIPPTFWDTRTCPEFIPPADILRAWYGATGCIEENGDGFLRSVTAIATTAYWTIHEGQLTRMPPDDAFEFVDPVRALSGSEPPSYSEMNLLRRELERSWRAAWYVRRRELRAQGVDLNDLPEPLCFDGRDRVATIKRYHREYWSPSDLPDSFWATDECPPFIPPTSVVRFEYGECAPDPLTGHPRTPIFFTDYWTQMIGEPTVVFVPGDIARWVPGCHPKGATPPESAEANMRHDLAKQEWEAEWRLRRQWLETE